MAIADLTTWNTRRRNALAIPFGKTLVTTAGTGITSLWRATPDAGAAAGASVALTSATTGALPLASGSAVRWFGTGGNLFATASDYRTIVLCDFLVMSGGLSGTSVATQTTNLPTAALPRYSPGTGVWVAMYCWTAVGTTTATATISYTNSSGTAGRTGTAYWYNPCRVADSMSLMTMQAGDVGVASVESVTLSGSTGTAGNFGVILFRPLAIVPTVAVAGRDLVVDSFQLSNPFTTIAGCCLGAFATSGGGSMSITTTLLWGSDS